jgi:acyl-CoA thioester hydrolase
MTMFDVYTTTTEILIPFHDVDPMNVVWHGHYVKYMELARCEFLDSIGYGYQAMADSGYAWPVVDMRIKYVKSLAFNQRICVETSLVEWEYRLKLNYLILDAVTGEKITNAYTIQVAVDQAAKEMCYESPSILSKKIKEHLGIL